MGQHRGEIVQRAVDSSNGARNCAFDGFPTMGHHCGMHSSYTFCISGGHFAVQRGFYPGHRSLHR
jgi:hypothetical protein